MDVVLSEAAGTPALTAEAAPIQSAVMSSVSSAAAAATPLISTAGMLTVATTIAAAEIARAGAGPAAGEHAPLATPRQGGSQRGGRSGGEGRSRVEPLCDGEMFSDEEAELLEDVSRFLRRKSRREMEEADRLDARTGGGGPEGSTAAGLGSPQARMRQRRTARRAPRFPAAASAPVGSLDREMRFWNPASTSRVVLSLDSHEVKQDMDYLCSNAADHPSHRARGDGDVHSSKRHLSAGILQSWRLTREAATEASVEAAATTQMTPSSSPLTPRNGPPAATLPEDIAAFHHAEARRVGASNATTSDGAVQSEVGGTATSAPSSGSTGKSAPDMSARMATGGIKPSASIPAAVAKPRRSGGGAGGAAVAAKFSMHRSRKGWLVCKQCKSSIWPPNCRKHLLLCA